MAPNEIYSMVYDGYEHEEPSSGCILVFHGRKSAVEKRRVAF